VRIVTAAFTLTAIAGIITAAHAAASINGRWTTKDKSGVIEMANAVLRFAASWSNI
jgi:hypothetical protein